MKKLLLFLMPLLMACTTKENVPDAPEKPTYIGLPIVSYTVMSKNELLVSGEEPMGSKATYSSTYNRRNQLIAGASATLTLTGMKGVKVRSITLHMHSNKSSGAGRLTVLNDTSTVWTIENAPFSSPSWGGAYTTDTAKVFHLFTPSLECGEQWQIRIEASVNSLYIMRYDIEYEPAPSWEETKDEEMVSGLKTIRFWDNYRWTGAVQGKYIHVLKNTTPIGQEDLYEVTYIGDTAATLLHYSTGTYIGVEGGSLSKKATHWTVEQRQDTTFVIYTKIKGRYYSLVPDADYDLNCRIMVHDTLFEQKWVLSSVGREECALR